MKIGAMRPEEAKVFDAMRGDHVILGRKVTIFWSDTVSRQFFDLSAGWYWSLEGEEPKERKSLNGPFGTSMRAFVDAEVAVEEMAS